MSKKPLWVSDATIRAIRTPMPKNIARTLTFQKTKLILNKKAELTDGMSLVQKMTITPEEWIEKLLLHFEDLKLKEQHLETLLEAEEDYYTSIAQNHWAA